MKAASGAMTATQAYSSVAETCGLKSKDVKAVIEGIVDVAADRLKKNGSFKLPGALNPRAFVLEELDQLTRSRFQHANVKVSCQNMPTNSFHRCAFRLGNPQEASAPTFLSRPRFPRPVLITLFFSGHSLNLSLTIRTES